MTSLDPTTPTWSHDVNASLDNASLTASQLRLHAANDAVAMTLLPVMIVLGVLCVVGILGNSLVCFVYAKRFRRGGHNFLITCLAFVDLNSCVLAIPYEIVDIRFYVYYVFDTDWFCRCMKFITAFINIVSILILLLIAVDRYRKVCRPLKPQLHVGSIRYLLIVVVVVSLVLSSPSLFVYGMRTIESAMVPGVMSRDCSTPDGVSGLYRHLFNGLLLICFVVISVTLIVLYARILQTVKNLQTPNTYSTDGRRQDSEKYTSFASDEDPNLPSSEISANCLAVRYTSANTVTFEMTSGHRSNNSAKGDNSNIIASPDESMTSSDHKTEVVLTELKAGDSQNSKPFVGELETSIFQNGTTPHTRFLNGGQEDSKTVDLSTAVKIDNGVLHSSAAYTFKTIDDSSSLKKINDSNTFKTINESNKSSTSSDDTESSATLKSNAKETTNDVTSENPVRDVNKKMTLSIQRSSSSRRRQRKGRYKTTMVAFSVTTVFILSYLPHLSLIILKLIFFPDMDQNPRGATFVAYNLFMRSFYINSMANPFVYGIMNVQFRREVQKLICCKGD
ncbi:uncharacterized protein LOC131952423 [Physella acuta]|uniref:uncharacterized protein LOC131952423 n=1 Tax=Physella acuta TaxID=109671 RepID=UPI0027DDCC41|nr:uncharacterized protein LOC131952423 [Physella acuta]